MQKNVWPTYTTDQNSSTPALQWYAIRTYFRRKNIPKFWTEFVKLDVKLKARMFYIMYQVFSHQSCSCNEKFEVKDTWSMTFFTTERRRALHKNTPDLLHKSWHFSITDLFRVEQTRMRAKRASEFCAFERSEDAQSATSILKCRVTKMCDRNWCKKFTFAVNAT